MSEKNLTDYQLQEAKTLDKTIRQLINIKEEMKDYKLDDIYIMEEWHPFHPKQTWIVKGHMGFPLKYKVVYISAEGVPHLRRLGPSGKPTGDVYLPRQASMLKAIMLAGQADAAAGVVETLETTRFVPDPEQLDSILLQEEFAPTADHKTKLMLFNEINKHNKRVTVPTGWNEFAKIHDFFKSLKAGDKFWKGADKTYIFQSLVKNKREWVITAIDQSQKQCNSNISYWHHKRLYKEAPRSFAKESAT